MLTMFLRLSGVLFVSLCICLTVGCTNNSNVYTAHIERIIENPESILPSSTLPIRTVYLKLDDEKYVRLAGVNIPTRGQPNYREIMITHIQTLLENNHVEIKTALQAYGAPSDDGYPWADLVVVYIGGENINKKVLSEGMGFYSFDIFEGHKEFLEVERNAKNLGKGIWKRPEELKILQVTQENWRYSHSPLCPYIKDIKPEKRMDIYVQTPCIYGRLLTNTFCEKCAVKE
jgi:endonuclease YncB( thermonuclease family)